MTENRMLLSRIAGMLYLIVIITGLFSLMYVPKNLFVYGNALETAQNISQKTGMFRISLASSVICYLAFTFLVIFLYQILRTVDIFVARVMVILALISVPVSFYNLINKYAILDLIKDNTSDLAQKSEKIMELLNNYDNGIFILTIFWGLWLLPFGFLIFRSGFYPKIIGVLLMVGCFGYLINFFGNTLFVDYQSVGVLQYLKLLPTVGEFSICFWLLVVGARKTKT
ncbi:DUF4386 domain-containing protein [Epilithonimonas pallida]|uniref:DUF4386 domain-containing protein n=2 Tax=Epilithonimonas pallida TaxID=373671 RepID=A0ABY1R805_9FLAO|nr:protein of unknown function [Epilithonimonas pallida]